MVACALIVQFAYGGQKRQNDSETVTNMLLWAMDGLLRLSKQASMSSIAMHVAELCKLLAEYEHGACISHETMMNITLWCASCQVSSWRASSLCASSSSLTRARCCCSACSSLVTRSRWPCSRCCRPADQLTHSAGPLPSPYSRTYQRITGHALVCPGHYQRISGHATFCPAH